MGCPLHPRCLKTSHPRWTDRSPALPPAGSQPHLAESDSSAGVAQTLALGSAPGLNCDLAQDGWRRGSPQLFDRYLEL